MGTATQIATRIKKVQNIKYVILAVVCSTAFFVHEFIEDGSKMYLDAVEQYKSVKAGKVAALKEVKKYAEGSEQYKVYLEESKNEELAWREFQKAKSKERFLAFDNFQQFVGELGWAIGLCIYALFNLVLALIRKNESLYGEVILHGVLILISFYFINWAVFRFEDYEKLRYVTYSLLTSSVIVFATDLLLRAKNKYMIHIEKSLRMMFTFLYKEAEEENLVNPDNKRNWRKKRVELTNKIIGNE